jgi:hypothetical protein
LILKKATTSLLYRLNNTGNWNVVGNQRNITMSNLPPGSYLLQLRASGKPGVEKIRELSFVIHPPFWKAIWFISLVALLLAVCIYFLYRRTYSAYQAKGKYRQATFPKQK